MNMNINPNMPQGMMPQQQMPVANVPPHIPPQHQVQLPQQTMDNVTKAKALLGPLKESLANTIKSAAQLIHYNNQSDNGGLKGVESSPMSRFDKHLEDFYAICDQIELHLKTAKTVIEQTSLSNQYMQLNVNYSRPDPIANEQNTISYLQFLDLVKRQINYAKEIHDILICAASNISPSE